MVEHQDGLAAGASYTVTTPVQVPIEPERAVLSLRDHQSAGGQPDRPGVRGGRRNQVNEPVPRPAAGHRPAAAEPACGDQHHAARPGDGEIGRPVHAWAGRSRTQSTTNPAPGSWSDAVYIGTGHDLEHRGRLSGHGAAQGTARSPAEATPTRSTAVMPSLTPGPVSHLRPRGYLRSALVAAGGARVEQDHGVGRLLTVAVDSLTLGVPYATTLSSGQERLLQVTVPAGGHARGIDQLGCLGRSQRDLLQARGGARRESVYDAAYQGGLSPNQTAVIPSTTPGRLLRLDRGQFGAGRRHARHRCWPSCFRCRSRTCRSTRGATASTSPPRSPAPSSSPMRSSSW